MGILIGSIPTDEMTASFLLRINERTMKGVVKKRVNFIDLTVIRQVPKRD